MRGFIIGLVAIASLALQSCAGPLAVAGPVVDAAAPLLEKAVATGNQVMIKGTAGFIIAEEFYQASNRTALAAVKTGLLPDGVLDRMQTVNRTATAWLQRGKDAKSEAARAKAAAELMSAALELRHLGGQRK